MNKTSSHTDAHTQGTQETHVESLHQGGFSALKGTQEQTTLFTRIYTCSQDSEVAKPVLSKVNYTPPQQLQLTRIPGADFGTCRKCAFLSIQQGAVTSRGRNKHSLISFDLGAVVTRASLAVSEGLKSGRCHKRLPSKSLHLISQERTLHLTCLRLLFFPFEWKTEDFYFNT